MKICCFALALISLLQPSGSPAQEDHPFRSQEIRVAPSPSDQSQLSISPEEKVVDFDIWPTGPEAAILVRSSSGYKVLLWTIGTDRATDIKLGLPAIRQRGPSISAGSRTSNTSLQDLRATILERTERFGHAACSSLPRMNYAV